MNVFFSPSNEARPGFPNWQDKISEINAKRDKLRSEAEIKCKANGHSLSPWTCFNSTLCYRCGRTVYLHGIHGSVDGPLIEGRAINDKCDVRFDGPEYTSKYTVQDYHGTTVASNNNWLEKTSQQKGWYGAQKGYWLALWVDPAGKIYDVESTHHGWISRNAEMLKEKYNIDIYGWEVMRLEEIQQEEYKYLLELAINDKSFKLDYPEEEVVLSDEEKEQLWQDASETHHRRHGIEIVDFLMENGWVRVSQTTAICFEGRKNDRLFDICEDVLLKRFPDVWKNNNLTIVINDMEIDSYDLRTIGNLKEAVEKEGKFNNYYLMNR